MCIFNRGDPTLVKTNVAITTGYLISGKKNTVYSGNVCKWDPRSMYKIVNLKETEFIFEYIFKALKLAEHFYVVNELMTPFLSFPCTFCFPDLLLIFYYWKAIGDKFFVIHHLAALYAYYYVLVSALLSNSRTCRQDGKKTTKGEQPCLVKLSVFIQ